MAYTLQEDHSDAGYSLAAKIHTTWYMCQTFTASGSYDLKKIDIPLCEIGSAPSLYVELWSVSGGEPDSVLKSQLVVGALSAYPSHDWVEVVFDAAYTVTEGLVYAIVVKSDGTGDTDNCGGWWYDSSGSWPGSEGWTNDSGGTWHMTGSVDHLFKIYSPMGVPNKPTTPSPENNDTGVDFSGFTLGWADGGGDTETYNVLIGETGALTPVSVAQEGTSYVTTLAELEAIFSASPIDQKIYWRVDATNDAGTTTGDEWNFDPRPAQATVPSPAHEATGVKLHTTPLSYTVDETVDIYFKIQGGAYTKVADAQDVSSWVTPYVILNIKDYNPSVTSGLRSPVAGDVLTHGDDSYTVTYVIRGVKINLQYQAKLYAFRTAGPGGKNPGDVLVDGAGDVRVTLNDQWFFHDDVEQIYLPPDTTFVWRVDATNNFGTSTGIEWEFTTPPFKQPKTSYVIIVGGSGNGPYDYPPGEEGVDWSWTGENNMASIRKLVVAAKNTIYVEDI